MTKAEQARLTAWRLKILHEAADVQNVARVCRSEPRLSVSKGQGKGNAKSG